jgi:CheY-like chemotaxis protein
MSLDPSATTTNGLKIVVIDDAIEILDLIDVVLSEEGFQVVPCQVATEALDTVAIERPALVIADLGMAGVQRWELVDALIADPRTEQTPIIVCSGATDELQAAEDRLRAQGGDVLGKPFDIDVLVQMVRTLTSRS